MVLYSFATFTTNTMYKETHKTVCWYIGLGTNLHKYRVAFIVLLANIAHVEICTSIQRFYQKCITAFESIFILS